MQKDITAAKRSAGEKAVEFIQPGMTVGLGTGSTAYWAIMKIGERVKKGLPIRAIATSEESERLARELSIPLISFSEISQIDIDIDGADEVDAQLRLIKGGGGALLREKIIATASKKFIVVADEHKYVTTLGAFPLPVEIIPFGKEFTLKKLTALTCNPVLRMKENKIFITDNGNYIADCSFNSIEHPETLQHELNAIPGVVENGLFVKLADTVIIGYASGETKVLCREEK